MLDKDKYVCLLYLRGLLIAQDKGGYQGFFSLFLHENMFLLLSNKKKIDAFW